MSVLYLIDQGAVLRKVGNRLVVEKYGKPIQQAHSFKIEQVIVIGNVQISSQTVSLLLEQGIDTVFLSINGKYKGRLVSQFGKNVILRQTQFKKMGDMSFILEFAKKCVEGKLKNYRTFLRRHNRELMKKEIEGSIHTIRNMIGKLQSVKDMDTLRGVEGKASNCYFQGIKHAIKQSYFQFSKRNRRPPRDPVNALLSLGYTLLANTIQTAVNIVGLDPYLGCLHSVDYGRPSLILDLMEEFRPVMVDSLVLRVINKRIITNREFYFQNDVICKDDDDEMEELEMADYPVLLTHEGMKKWIMQYEALLKSEIYYPPCNRRTSYRNICLEQARLLVRYLKGEDEYTPFLIK